MAEELVYKITRGQLQLAAIRQILKDLDNSALLFVIQDTIDTFSKRDRLSLKDIASHQLVLQTGFNRSIITPEKDIVWIFEKDIRAFTWISAVKACSTLPAEQAQLDKVRVVFARKVPKTSKFWGYYYLERFYAYLMSRDKQFQDRYSKDAHDKEVAMLTYVSDFMIQNMRFLPPGFDLRDVFIRYICLLRYEIEAQRPLIELLISRIFQISPKDLTGLRFGFEFFRYSFDEKISPYFPQAALFQLLRKLSVDQINKEIDNTFIGMIWTEENYRISIKSLMKVGILPSTAAIILKIKDNALRNNTIEPLIQLVEGDILVAFVYLKFDNLFPTSMNLLKEFILGAPPRNKTFEKVVERAETLLSSVSAKNRPQVIEFLEAVKIKYENFCSVQELQIILQAKANPRSDPKKIQQLLQKYDWLSFQAKQGQQLSAKTTAHFRGLCNIGNTCYMNSFLQALYMTREFRFQVLDLGITAKEKQLLDKHKEKDIDFKRKELKMIRQRMAPLVELQKLFALLYKSRRPYINPSFLKNILPIQFRNFFQHDAGEFGRIFLDGIQETQDHLCYEGTSDIIIRCEDCKSERRRTEKFMDLMLSPCAGDDVQSLKKMIEKHDEPEELSGLQCEKCAKPVQKSSKRTRISQLPPYLIITLNRFTYSVQQKKKLKLDFRIDIPQAITLEEHNGEMITEHPYDLYAIIVHRGTSAQSGHYFTFSRADTLQQNWVCFDDSTITCLDSFERVNQLTAGAPNDTPYILFYQDRQHIEKLVKNKFFTTPLILSQKLTAMIEKQDIEHMKDSQKQKFTLPKVNIPYSFFIRKDQDQDDMSRGGGGGNRGLIM